MKSTNLKKIYLKDGVCPEEFWRESKKMLKALENVITFEFLAAVNKYDGHKIIEIAESVWFLKSALQGEHGGNFKDVERARLILIKAQLDQAGKKIKIRKVAELLAGKKVETPADGFKSLRDKCRAMDFPLDEKREIRKK